MTDCFYCGRPLRTNVEFSKEHSIINKLLPSPNRRNRRDRPDLTWDHIIPRALTKGLPNNNVVACCPECNNKKRDLTIEEYRVLQAFRYGYVSGVTWSFPGEKNSTKVPLTLPRAIW
jgi:5-methylcytosine-specific restriction endonuclease McrA